MYPIAAILMAGCEGSSEPPVACGDYPEQSVAVGERVELTMCFTDPQGSPLTMTAAVEDPSLVQATLVGSALFLDALSPGSTMVMVEASNSSGLSAISDIAVVVPNRPPVATRHILPPIYQVAGTQLTKELGRYAKDPDEVGISWSVGSANESVMLGSLSGEILTTAAGEVGTTTLTLVASDGFDHLDFRLPVEVFNGSDWSIVEMFNSQGMWNPPPGNMETVYKISNGEMEIHSLNASWIAAVVIPFTFSEENWALETLGIAVTNALPGLFVLLDHERYFALSLTTGWHEGTQSDYRLAVFDSKSGWVLLASGRKEGIGAGKYLEMSMGVEDGVFWMEVEGERIRASLPDGLDLKTTEYVGVLSWPSSDAPAEASRYDWVRVSGGDKAVPPQGLSLDPRILQSGGLVK